MGRGGGGGGGGGVIYDEILCERESLSRMML